MVLLEEVVPNVLPPKAFAPAVAAVLLLLLPPGSRLLLPNAEVLLLPKILPWPRTALLLLLPKILMPPAPPLLLPKALPNRLLLPKVAAAGAVVPEVVAVARLLKLLSKVLVWVLPPKRLAAEVEALSLKAPLMPPLPKRGKAAGTPKPDEEAAGAVL